MDKNDLSLLLADLPRERSQILPALHVAHDALHCLPPWSLKAISEHLGVPGVEVESIAHSYSELRLNSPPPSIDVHVCTGLSCWLRGAPELLEQARQIADSDHEEMAVGELDCAFMCGVAPVVEVNGAYIGKADGESVTRVVSRAKGSDLE